MRRRRDIIQENLSLLEEFHYVSRISRRTKYWGGLKRPTLESCEEKRGENFNVIIYDSQGSGEFYSIPYPVIKPILNIKKGYLPNQRRWQYDIKEHILRIHGSDEQLSIEKYFMNSSNIPQLVKIGNDVMIDEASLREHERLQTIRIRRMSDRDLNEKARAKPAGPMQRRTALKRIFLRDPYVSEYARRRAKGVCQLCDQPAPFKVQGIPFLEVHHIISLAESGPDTIENTVALCPNCHRQIHHLDSPIEKELLRKRAEI